MANKLSVKSKQIIKRIINIICKILLILTFIVIVENLMRDKLQIIFPITVFIFSIIGILKTTQKKNIIFLILAIISICLAIFIPIIIMFSNVFIISFLKLFLGFKDISIIDGITMVPSMIFYMKGGLLLEVILNIIAISFVIIYIKQKNVNK